MPPSAPSDLVVSVADSQELQLDWTDNSANEDEFAIFRSTNGVDFSEIDTVAADVTTYLDTGLTNGQIYYYYVVARNAIGDSSASNTDSETAAHSLSTGLLGFWKLSDTSDALGVRTLTNNGSTPFVAGKVGNCADMLIASGQYLSRASATLGFTTAMTISVWYKQDSAANDKTIIQIGNDGLNPRNFLKMESNYWHVGGNTQTTTTTGGIATSTNWINWIITIDGTTAHSYVNGADTPVTLNEAFGTDISRAFYIGAYNNGSETANFNGLIDAVGLWSRAITAAEVADLYNAGTGLEHPFNI